MTAGSVVKTWLKDTYVAGWAAALPNNLYNDKVSFTVFSMVDNYTVQIDLNKGRVSHFASDV